MVVGRMMTLESDSGLNTSFENNDHKNNIIYSVISMQQSLSSTFIYIVLFNPYISTEKILPTFAQKVSFNSINVFPKPPHTPLFFLLLKHMLPYNIKYVFVSIYLSSDFVYYLSFLFPIRIYTL